MPAFDAKFSPFPGRPGIVGALLAGPDGASPLPPPPLFSFKFVAAAVDRSTRFSHASDSLSRYPHHGKFTGSNFGVDV
jgi:hypothetical protein